MFGRGSWWYVFLCYRKFVMYSVAGVRAVVYAFLVICFLQHSATHHSCYDFKTVAVHISHRNCLAHWHQDPVVETLICLGTPCTPHLVKLAAFLGVLCFGHDRCRSIVNTTQQQYQVVFLCTTSFQYVILGLRVRYSAECDVVFLFLGLAEHIRATTKAVALNGSVCRNMWRY